MIRLGTLALGCVCLVAWLAPDADAQKKPVGKPVKKGPVKGPVKKGGNTGTGANLQMLGEAVRNLQEARVWIQQAQPIYDGHRERAYGYVGNAISELYQASATGNTGAPPKGKGVKGKTPPKKGSGTSTPLVTKLTNNNNLPAGWEVSNGQMLQAANLIKTAIGQMKGSDPHVQAANAQAQLAIQEINAGLTFMNSLAKNAGTNTKKSGR